MEKLLLASDSLRSQVAKNALLALTDLFSHRPYLQNGQIGDAEITQSYSKLLKKAADTNQFLSIEASAALSNLVANTPYAKSIQQLNIFYEEKSVNMRKQISLSLEHIMNSIGSPNISNLPPPNRKQLFAMLVFYLGDGNQDVRINTKKAILTLEYGNNPLGGR